MLVEAAHRHRTSRDQILAPLVSLPSRADAPSHHCSQHPRRALEPDRFWGPAPRTAACSTMFMGGRRASNGISVISLGDLLFHRRIAHWAFEGVALCRRSRSWSSLCNPFWKRDSGSRQGKGLGISHCQRQANNHGISKREFAHAPITGTKEALAARLGCPLVKW